MSIETITTPRTAYYRHLNDIQKETLSEAETILTRELGELFFRSCSLLTTGSIARSESTSQGGIDLILVCKEERASASPSRDTPHSFSGRSFSVSTPSNPLEKFTPSSPFTPPSQYSAADSETFWRQESTTPDAFLTNPSRSKESNEDLANIFKDEIERVSSPINDETRRIEAVLRNHPHLFFQSLQVHTLNSTISPLKYSNRSGRGVTIPSRALDAQHFVGDQGVTEEYRIYARRCIREMNNESRKKFEGDFVRPAIKELEACITSTATKPVNFQTGALYFDGKKMMSTKYPLIRAVQHPLMNIFFHAVHDDKMMEPDKLRLHELQTMNIPSRTDQRIRWMHSQGMLSMNQNQVEELCTAYCQALRWYEQSRIAFETKEEGEISVPPTELQQVARTISSFVKNNPPAPLSPQRTGKLS